MDAEARSSFGRVGTSTMLGGLLLILTLACGASSQAADGRSSAGKTMPLADELIDDKRKSAAQVGQTLTAAAVAPVFYPRSITLDPAVERILPVVTPPIRADRETVLLRKGSVPAVLRVKLEM